MPESGAATRICVVVPCYGHAEHLEACLDSVARQCDPGRGGDGELDLQLVVVDDASPDQSVEVAGRVLDDEAFSSHFQGGVRLERFASNRGAHAALDHGMQQADAEWIALLNSDDCYAPGRLSRLRGRVGSSGARLAFSGVAFLDEGGRPSPECEETFHLRRHQAALERAPSVGFALLEGNAALTSGNLFFHRSLLEEVGGFRDLLLCHDWDFLLRAVERTEPCFDPRPLYLYRLHPGNSFRDLGDRAEEETGRVLSRYLEAVEGAVTANPLAPSAAAWPGVFEREAERLGLWRHHAPRREGPTPW